MFNKENNEQRFIKKDAQGLGIGAIAILVDTKTGVNYLVAQTPYSGITPLLDENGNVVIDK
ncbi:MAG: hypothetical protein ATN31_08090 [Candidatus Epulonipiscioides saccharophilum]|nr:MAG: hypothetical protein ATN31_08090 [Epulopiscium sp. AS2M-Bin001]